MPKIQVLVSCMNKKSMEQIVSEMNIQTEAIIINQCDTNDVERKIINENEIQMYSFSERGVGVSRNNALVRANADIIIIADEDVRYVDNYVSIIEDAFKKTPDADMIVFNVPSENKERPVYEIKKGGRVYKHNCLRYGAVKFVIKLDRLREKNIFFSLLFGGGAKYGSGEDSLFIMECVRKGLKVYSNPTIIGYVKQDDSTWFKGYTEKYFIDKGALYACLFPKFTTVFCIQYLVRHKNILNNDINIKKAFNLMKQGVSEIKGGLK